MLLHHHAVPCARLCAPIPVRVQEVGILREQSSTLQQLRAVAEAQAVAAAALAEEQLGAALSAQEAQLQVCEVCVCWGGGRWQQRGSRVCACGVWKEGEGDHCPTQCLAPPSVLLCRS